jgi:hypothetical protein
VIEEGRGPMEGGVVIEGEGREGGGRGVGGW